MKTLKEIMESKEGMAIHCPEEWQAEKLCEALENLEDGRLKAGEYSKDNTHWRKYKSYTGYDNIGSYDKVDNYDCDYGFTIIEFEDVDLEEKLFTKSDLKNGDIVVQKSGDVAIAIPEFKILKYKDGYDAIECWDGNFCSVYKSQSIVDIFRPQEPHQCSFCPEDYTKGKLMFHREEPKQMAKAEIEKELGYKIEIEEGKKLGIYGSSKKFYGEIGKPTKLKTTDGKLLFVGDQVEITGYTRYSDRNKITVPVCCDEESGNFIMGIACTINEKHNLLSSDEWDIKFIKNYKELKVGDKLYYDCEVREENNG